ncbi:MAG: hypothetical protein ABIR71_03670 [Chthoniobacterales bacterium]
MRDYDPHAATLRNIRRLIWLYFWLLFFEGALRKWVVPQLSNPLLIVRDPVVILIYILAIRARVFPTNGWMVSLGVISVLATLLTFVPLWPYVSPARIALVTGFGFRSSFLHLPLIFIVGRVLRMEDVKRCGWWTLILMVPMVILMVGQFQTPPDSFLNRTVGGEGEMMTSALGKVRTAGTFSFVVGIVAYFALAIGFLIWAALRRDVYPNWLLYCAGVAMVIGVAISGSRSVVGSCAVVASSLLAVVVLRPSALNRFGQTVLVTLVLGFLVMQTPIFKEGLNVLTTRFNEVAEATETSIGLGVVERMANEFSDSFRILAEAPFLGYGLGVGTNGGAKFLTGQSVFLLSEGEWGRLILESGPVLGVAFIIWRFALTVGIGRRCLRAVRAGDTLPLLLFSSAFMPLLIGQLGHPTIVGFAILTTGMVLAVLGKIDGPEAVGNALGAAARSRSRPLPRRSAYASRLHRQDNGQPHTNGSTQP